jgi:hypothetical protein
MLPLIINFGLFQACWFLALFYQHQATWAMAVICTGLLLTHHNIKQQLTLVLACLPIGIVVEIVAIQGNLIRHVDDSVPIWLGVLWVALILTFDSSLRKIITLPKRAGALVFGAFAPLSYIAGDKFGVFEIIPSMYEFYFVFSIIWLACTLFIIMIYDCIFVKS